MNDLKELARKVYEARLRRLEVINYLSAAELELSTAQRNMDEAISEEFGDSDE